MEVLRAAMAGEEPESRLVAPTLVMRASTGPPRA
jgi:hypothetical protein